MQGTGGKERGRDYGSGQRPGRRMLLLALLAVAALAMAGEGYPAEGPRPPLSRRVVRYEIRAELDHAERIVRGRERVAWRNPGLRPVGELRLHLYLNGFKNRKSTFMRESGGRARDYRFRDGMWGYIDLNELSLADGTDLLAGAGFIHPDDDNPDDETMLRVPLPEPVDPGDEIVFEATFTARLPQVFARTGYRSDFYLVAQWYPKLAVYEPAGRRGRAEEGWNSHQFHALSEFYADFGSFDVSLTVPDDFVVGATGSEAAPPESSGGKTTYRFVQDDVHDFAWTADPDFVKEVRTFRYADQRDPGEERRMARLLDLDGEGIPPAGSEELEQVPEELRLGEIEVTMLLHPEHAHQMDRHFEAAFNAIRYFGYWYGPYPYRTLTVVDPTYGGRGAGGMEYPTFITAGSAFIAPEQVDRPEGVIIHEYGHQYWYGLVANNEFEEPWLDEGLNTYSTGKVLEKAYPPSHSTMSIAGITVLGYPLITLPGDDGGSREPASGGLEGRATRLLSLRWAGPSSDSLLNAFRDLPMLTFPDQVPIPSPWDRRHRYVQAGPTKDQLVEASWEFYDRGSYGLNAYSKPALMLRTLETIIGEEKTQLGLRRFHRRFRFGHPGSADFVESMSEEAGEDLSWFFDQTLFGSGVLDYAIAEIESSPPEPAAGIFGKGEDRRMVTEDQAREEAGDDKEFELNVAVRRLGEVALPVTIEITYEDGSTDLRRWDGRSRWHRIRETVDRRAVSARILPAAGRPLDIDWSNDARTVRPNRWPALKWWTRMLGWAQQVLFFYSGMA